ncbi:hypothetical protein LC040_03855 [Bacillus tianshenii]|nr:hypothetical protein LC040_03855 [Bacillus tianshenii]
MRKQIGIEINRCVYTNDGNIGANEFFKAFIAFLKQKEWYFGGGMNQINEEGKEKD